MTFEDRVEKILGHTWACAGSECVCNTSEDLEQILKAHQAELEGLVEEIEKESSRIVEGLTGKGKSDYMLIDTKKFNEIIKRKIK